MEDEQAGASREAEAVRRELLRFVAVAGMVLAVVALVQLGLGAASAVWHGRAWPSNSAWRPMSSPLQFAGFWLNLAGFAMLLPGSVRLLAGVRRGGADAVAGRRPMLAYAGAAIAARACLYLSGVLDRGARDFDRVWLIVGGLGDAIVYCVYPAIVLLVLLRLAPPPAKTDRRRGFEVLPRSGDS